MRRAKKPAVAMAGLAFAGAMALVFGSAGASPATATSQHLVAAHGGGGCENWGDCWDTWRLGGRMW
jgi:hypothetical protein